MRRAMRSRSPRLTNPISPQATRPRSRNARCASWRSSSANSWNRPMRNARHMRSCRRRTPPCELKSKRNAKRLRRGGQNATRRFRSPPRPQASPRHKPGSITSMCSSRRQDGLTSRMATERSTLWWACQPPPIRQAMGMSITSFGAATASLWQWSRPKRRWSKHGQESTKPSCTPIVWRPCTASALSSFTPTDLKRSCGTTPFTLSVKCMDSSARMSSSAWWTAASTERT